MIEKLKAKLAEIQQGKEKTQANLNALIGAEQILLQLIEEETTESEAVENATDNN